LVSSVGKNAEFISNEKRPFGDSQSPYISFSNSLFLRVLIAIRWKLHREGYGKPYSVDKNIPKFIDVGCGIGDKVILARQMDFIAHGIESDPRLVKYAKKIFNITDSEKNALEQDLPFIIHGNASHYTYDSYQAIFLNAPYQDKKLEIKLEKKIYSQAGLGTFIIMPSYACLPPKEDYAQGKNFGGKALHVFRRTQKSGKRLVAS
jgi:hypothetical protein